MKTTTCPSPERFQGCLPWNIFASSRYFSRQKDLHIRSGCNERYFRRPGNLQIKNRSFALFYGSSGHVSEHHHQHIQAFCYTTVREKYIPRKFIMCWYPPGTRFSNGRTSPGRAPFGWGESVITRPGGATFVWCGQLRYVYLHEWFNPRLHCYPKSYKIIIWWSLMN